MKVILYSYRNINLLINVYILFRYDLYYYRCVCISELRKTAGGAI